MTLAQWLGNVMTVHYYRTRVFKLYDKWRVEYYMPYSGFLYADHDKWTEAMIDACDVEQQKVWT